jgi:hypothetical protein
MTKVVLALVLDVALLVVRALAQNAHDDGIRALWSGTHAGLTLLGVGEGHFTSTYDQQYVVFYEDRRGRDPRQSRTIECMVVEMADGAIVRSFDLSKKPLAVWSLDYTERALEVIRGLSGFGKWNGFSYTGDFNGNGLDELLFFSAGGSFFLPMIVEFDGTGFRQVLDFRTPFRELSKIEAEVHNGVRTLMLYGRGTLDRPGKRDWYRYAWDSDERRYRIVEQGVEP